MKGIKRMKNSYKFTEFKYNLYSHKEEKKEFTSHVDIDREARGVMESHIKKYFGPIHKVYHDTGSHRVHIEVYHITPNEERPFHTLITQGMSDKPMNTPSEAEDSQYAELLCFLPPDWDISEDSFKNQKLSWPLENLKFLALFPHEFNTWIGFGHTIQNDNLIQPFASNTKLCASLLLPPIINEEKVWLTHVREGKTINFYNVIPLYESERKYKMKRGIAKLLDLFDKYEISQIYDIHRKNVV